jgi:tetratricopeptide (TPR) repeat protein
MACEFQGNVSEAVDSAARALEINCHDTVALRIVQRIAREQGDLTMAAKASAMAEEATPFIKGETTFYSVLELVEKGEYDSALEVALDLEKTISTVHEKSLRGVILMLLRELERWTELEHKLNQVAAFAEFDPDCHAAAASLAAHRGDLQGAIESLQIGLQRYPESTQLRAQYLMDLGRAMKTEELELATADVLALHIGNPGAYSELIDGLYEAGQLEAALELLHKGLEAFPEDDVLGLLALSLMMDSGDFKAA